MRTLAAVVGIFCAGCATPFAQVKDAKTIEEARKRLGSYEPAITPYPPNAEAWYFGKNECVLFVDGKVRLTRSARTESEWSNGAIRPRPDSERSHVVCAPSGLSR